MSSTDQLIDQLEAKLNLARALAMAEAEVELANQRVAELRAQLDGNGPSDEVLAARKARVARPRKVAAKKAAPVKKSAALKRAVEAIKVNEDRVNAKPDVPHAGLTVVITTDGEPTNAEVREWAKGEGIAVADRGRVPAELKAQYKRLKAERAAK